MAVQIPWKATVDAKLGGIALGLLAVSFLWMAGSLYELAAIERDAAAMNHAGRGRMQGYQILYLADQLFDQRSEDVRSRVVADLREAMTRTEQRFSELRNGAPALGVPPMANPLILDKIRKDEGVWRAQIEPALERVIAITSREEARPTLESLDGTLADFVASEDEIVRLYQETAQTKVQRFRILQYLFVVVVAVVMALVLGFARSVSRRTNALAATAERITAGEVSLQAPVSGTDELAVLGKAFNVMTTRLRETTARSSAQEAEMRAILNSTADGIIAIDQQGSVTLFNGAAEKIFGYRAEDVIGRNISMLMPEPYREPHDGYLARYLRTGEPLILDTEREFEGLRRDGTKFPLVLRVREMRRDGSSRESGPAFVGVVQDITIRRQAEQQLADSELRFRSIAQAASDAIVSADSNGRIVFWNEAARRIFGYTEQEAVGQSLTLLIPESYREGLGQSLQRFLSTGDEARVIGRTVEFRGLRKNGEEFPLELSLSMWPKGPELFFTGIIRDIASRKQLEVQLGQTQRLEAIGRLAGGIAHDFNNLLTAILGYTNVLLEELGSSNQLPGQFRKDLEEVRNSGERAAALTKQLLAFSRKQTLQPTVFNLNAVVVNLEGMLRRVIGEDIDLRSVLAPDLGQVRADVGQLEQVLMNLAVNARDAMPEGGKLTIETTNVDLDAEYARLHVSVTPGRYVMVAVSDTGVGMSPEIQARLFEPFFTTKPKGQGTGLGLATVYGIVKQSGGNIWVYSEAEKGTTFKIYLPLVDELPAEAKPAGHAEEVRGGSETVLLVEDEDAVRGLARQVLMRWGYTVLEASSAENALRVAAEHAGPMHLLLTDVIMPGMSGRLLAQHLTEQHQGLKVLYISGYTDNAIVHHGVLAPGIALVQKPFTPKTMARAVREILDASLEGSG